MIGYGHFEMQLVVTKTTYEYVDGPYCAYGGSSTSAVTTLLNANNGTFDFESGFLVNLFNVPAQNMSEFVNLNWNAFFNQGLVSDHSFTDVGAGSTVNTSAFAFYANDYETTRQAAINSLDYQSMIWGGVCLGLTIAAIATAAFTGGASLLLLSFTVGGLVAGAGAASEGIAAYYEQSQNNPMFTSISQITADSMWFVNTAEPGQSSSMNINLYESAQPQTMIISGQSYTFGIQSPYVYADTS
ncbi:MAG: hypothetical protein ACYCSG_06085, partial [Thermoplasmataceae archaeon]